MSKISSSIIFARTRKEDKPMYKRRKESDFQGKFIKELEARYPEAIVSKMSANYIQGIPDVIALFPNGKYANFECKDSKDAPHQPNQDDYVDKLNNMSFARFVYPENKQEVLDELEQALRT